VLWWLVVGLGIVLLVAAAGCVVVAIGMDRRVLAMRGTGTLPALEVSRLHLAGERGMRCEVSGVIECDSPLSAPLSMTLCVAYMRQIIREVQPGVHSDFEEQRRHDYRRDRVEIDPPEERRVRFVVRDASGTITVDPAWATIDMPRTDERYESVTSGVGMGMGATTVDARQVENALALGTQVYVLGYLGEVYGEPAIVRHPSDQTQPFVISHRSEEALERSETGRSNLLYMAAGLSGVFGVGMVVFAVLRIVATGV
jgi:hypothetical protein